MRSAEATARDDCERRTEQSAVSASLMVQMQRSPELWRARVSHWLAEQFEPGGWHAQARAAEAEADYGSSAEDADWIAWHMRGTLKALQAGRRERPRELEALVLRSVEAARRLERERLAATGSVALRFRQLADEWTRETRMTPTVRDMVMHRAYQQIIGLGPEVVPLILAELENRPAYWFWALTAITGEDPAAGLQRFGEARDAWLAWGREAGYLPQAA
jgi:hypothetical protein